MPKNENKRGKTKKEGKKRDKVYAFYCTNEELKGLESKAKKRYLTIAEYFRVKLFSEWGEGFYFNILVYIIVYTSKQRRKNENSNQHKTW